MTTPTEDNEMDNADYAPSGGALAHKNNICVGRARVIWATTTVDMDAAWVLPGGRRTTDKVEALDAARLMNQLFMQRTLR